MENTDNNHVQGSVKDDKKEACRTFVEQTKLLMSLASAFVLAPAAVQVFLRLKLDWRFALAELFFTMSVALSYPVLGSVAGVQYNGTYNLYRRVTKWGGRLQFLSYLMGLAFFGLWLSKGASTNMP